MQNNKSSSLKYEAQILSAIHLLKEPYFVTTNICYSGILFIKCLIMSNSFLVYFESLYFENKTLNKDTISRNES